MATLTLQEEIFVIRTAEKARIKTEAQALLDLKEAAFITEIKRLALTGVNNINVSAFFPTTDKNVVERFTKIFCKKHSLTYDQTPFGHITTIWFLINEEEMNPAVI